MIYPCQADIVPFVNGLTQALQPYAEANDVSISFTTEVQELRVHYQPYILCQSLFYLVCDIINLLPPKNEIRIRLLYSSGAQLAQIEIENTGINLLRVKELEIQSIYSFTAYALSDGTLYKLALPLEHQPTTQNQYHHKSSGINTIPPFYAEIQKRLRSYFTETEKITAALELNRPEEAAFMQKINTIIKVNLDNEGFDTNALCREMSLSRTQLFRRLTSLIKQAPANYIKTMRLQRAKELLETTDLTVSEVAFKTSFRTLSHFTKIFRKRYSILPSHFRRSNKNATNE